MDIKKQTSVKYEKQNEHLSFEKHNWKCPHRIVYVFVMDKFAKSFMLMLYRDTT